MIPGRPVVQAPTLRESDAAARPAGSHRVWLRALELTAPITKTPDRVLPTVIDELAAHLDEAPALLSDRESLTYRALTERANRYGGWALEHGIGTGDAVALFMPNRPEYLAIWLGVTRVGGVVALLNTNLAGSALAHCIDLVAPRHVIVAAELIAPFMTALPHLAGAATIWVHGTGHDDFPRVDLDVDRRAGEPLGRADRRPPTIEDRALYIYTSGTTGLPKAASVSHFRLMQWSHWFAGLMDVRGGDRMYDCLPMYHSVGGVVAPGAALVGGASVALREKFSARDFWRDVVRWDGASAVRRTKWEKRSARSSRTRRTPAGASRRTRARRRPSRRSCATCSSRGTPGFAPATSCGETRTTTTTSSTVSATPSAGKGRTSPPWRSPRRSARFRGSGGPASTAWPCRAPTAVPAWPPSCSTPSRISRRCGLT